MLSYHLSSFFKSPLSETTTFNSFEYSYNTIIFKSINHAYIILTIQMMLLESEKKYFFLYS